MEYVDGSDVRGFSCVDSHIDVVVQRLVGAGPVGQTVVEVFAGRSGVPPVALRRHVVRVVVEMPKNQPW